MIFVPLVTRNPLVSPSLLLSTNLLLGTVHTEVSHTFDLIAFPADSDVIASDWSSIATLHTLAPLRWNARQVFIFSLIAGRAFWLSPSC